MYNQNDPHAAFQQLAAQAMVTNSQNNQNNRLSEVSEAPSTMSRYGDDFERDYTTSPATRRKQQPLSPPPKGPIPAQAGGAQGGAYARFSVTGTAQSRFAQPGGEQLNKDMRESIPGGALSQPGAAVPPRPNRPSTQSRRSEQVYAARRSVANARVSAAGTVVWSGEDEIDDLDWEPVKEPAKESRSAKFWRWFWILAPILFSLIFVTAGVMYLLYGDDRMVHNLQIWRLCFFLAGLPVVWWVGAGVSKASVWVVENSQLFKMQKALYYAYAVRVSSEPSFLYFACIICPPPPISYFTFSNFLYLVLCVLYSCLLAASSCKCDPCCFSTRHVGSCHDGLEPRTRCGS